MDTPEVKIDITAANSAADDVKRCLMVLLGTRAGTLALDREFGLDWSFLDMPTEAAKAACAAEILEKIRRYEPRAHVARVTFGGDVNGKFTPRIEVDAINV